MGIRIEMPADRDALGALVRFQDRVYETRSARWLTSVDLDLPILTGESPFAEGREIHPLWALEGGDCRDDLKDVHPDQTTFFEVGYPDDTRTTAGKVSFDYDCNTSEDLQEGTAPAPTCDELLTCAGSGYVAVNPVRTGPGVNGICGSTAFVTLVELRIASPS